MLGPLPNPVNSLVDTHLFSERSQACETDHSFRFFLRRRSALSRIRFRYAQALDATQGWRGLEGIRMEPDTNWWYASRTGLTGMKPQPCRKSFLAGEQCEPGGCTMRSANAPKQTCIRGGRIPGRDLETCAQAGSKIPLEMETAGCRTPVVIDGNGVQCAGEHDCNACACRFPESFNPARSSRFLLTGKDVLSSVPAEANSKPRSSPRLDHLRATPFRNQASAARALLILPVCWTCWPKRKEDGIIRLFCRPCGTWGRQDCSLSR